jgi:hypothetical protein
MGFMDKAKKLAEQAQQTLDETQKKFNQSSSPQAQPGDAGTSQPGDAAASRPGEAPASESPASGAANAGPDPFKPIQ